MTEAARVLVAGIGNIFLGDDGFGCEVAKRLGARAMPEGVRVADFGIRGFDLAFALLDGYDAAIFVDAAARGGAPGTLYTIEAEAGGATCDDARAMVVDTHGMDPSKVLLLARTMGAEVPRLLVVGCEPDSFGDEDEGRMGLSPPVEAAVDEAVRVVERLVGELLHDANGRAH